MERFEKETLFVGVLDDHHIFRSGLIHLIEQLDSYEVIYDTDNPINLLKYKQLDQIDILILDISLPSLSGLSVIEKLNEKKFSGKIVILSMFDETEFGLQSIQRGAVAYLSKSVVVDELINCLETVRENRLYISSTLSEILSNNIKNGIQLVPHLTLSEREKEILYLLAEGKRPIEIAKSLFLSIKTVSSYKSKIFDRLSIKNQSDLILYSIKHGIIMTPSKCI